MSATGLLLFLIAIWIIVNAGHLVSLTRGELTFTNTLAGQNATQTTN